MEQPLLSGPLLLTLTFCLLPVGGSAQVHLRRHGQGGPGAHPGSRPHRCRPPSLNSCWGPRAGGISAQGRRGSARTAAGPSRTRRRAGPGARGAEQLPRRTQLCQTARHLAPRRLERAAPSVSPPTGTLFTVLAESLSYLLLDTAGRTSPRQPAPSRRNSRPEKGAPRGTLELVVRAAGGPVLVHTVHASPEAPPAPEPLPLRG